MDTLSTLDPENSEMNQRGSGGTGNTGPLGFPSDSPTKHRCWKGKGYDVPMVTCSTLWHGQVRQARLPERTLQRDKSLGKKSAQGREGKRGEGKK